MDQRYLMGLDAGDGGGHCLLVNVETGQLTTTFRAWSHRPAPATGGWGGDLDIAQIWRVLGETTHETLARANAKPAQVLGLAATGMRHGLVLVAADGRELMACAPHDTRAAAEALTLREEQGGALAQQTGHWPTPACLAARLRWLARHAPETLATTRLALSFSDWLGFRLTDMAAAERSEAAESLLLALTTGDWAGELLAELSLPPAILPPVQEAGRHLGTLTASAANHLGLPAGLPVAVGGSAVRSGLAGAGAYAPGTLVALSGATAAVQWITDHPLLPTEPTLQTGPHLIPGRWVLESDAGPLGQMLESWARLLYPDSPRPVAALGAEAATVPPGAPALFFPAGASHFHAGQWRQPGASLVLPSTEGGPPPERPALARALWEGLAYALKATILPLLEAAGAPLTAVMLGGGLTRSAGWTQLVSEVLAVPVTVAATPETAALGAALCAGVAAGVYPSLETAAQALTAPARRHTPDPAAVQRYQPAYSTWNAQHAHYAAATLSLSHQPGESRPARPASSAPPAPAGFRPRFYVTAALDAASVAALREVADVEYNSYREALHLLSGDDLVEALQGYHGFITELDVVEAEVLRRLPDLRVIGVCRGAPVNVDIAACTAFGLPVLNTPGRNADAVADLTLAFMLTLLRQLPAAHAFLREPGNEAGDLGRLGLAYTRFQGRELWQKTVGLIGFGAVGRQVARRLRAFGARVLVYDPYLTEEQAALGGVEPVTLARLLAESDLISLHVPVTAETRGLLNAAAFAHMKRGALLINTARAALVDETALLEALRSGQLGGAALDVFAVEPPGADHPLLALPNVIATPHLGGDTVEVAAHQGQMIAADVRRLLRGERPLHLRNPEVLAHFSWTAPRPTPSAEVLARLSSSVGPAVTDLEVESAAERQALAPTAPPAPSAAPLPVALPSPPPTAVPLPKTGGLLAGLRRLLGGRQATSPASAPGPGVAARDQMTRLLQRFTEGLRVHEGLRAFSQGKHTLIHFILTDLELSFYVNCQDGTVEAALGAPPTPPDVTLKLRAALLDGIFTGRVNAVRAAMSGQLSFSGDTAKAMAFQRIQKEIGDLYATTREAVGGLGDLTTIAPAPTSPPSAAPTPPTTVTPAVPAALKTGDVRAELLAILNELYAHGLITATGGNLSARVAGTAGELWITPSQSFKGELRPDMMVRLDLDGRPLEPNALPPSSEWRVHTAIYRRRPDLRAVIHTHAPQTILLGLTGKPFLPITTEAAFIGDFPRVPFMMPGTQELADAVAEALGDGVAVLMQHHGLVVAGSSLRRAANVTEIIEETAEKILACFMLGQAPPTLPDDVVAQLREIGTLKV